MADLCNQVGKKKKWYASSSKLKLSCNQSHQTHIVKILGVSDEQIHPVVNVPAKAEGAINHIEGNGYNWERFRIRYQYRDGEEICEQWSEVWTERCNLNLVARQTSTESGQRRK